MRCYFMRDGHIQHVKFMQQGADEDLIDQAKRLFKVRNTDRKYDAFEVWSGKRFVYEEPDRKRQKAALNLRQEWQLDECNGRRQWSWRVSEL